jgi:group II intron reverse transcriptase/maturase
MAKGSRFINLRYREVCVMQGATTILKVLQDRGKRGLKLERLYRHLFNRELYLLAYAKLSSHQGALTPGTTTETADGMSMDKIAKLIDALKVERFPWTAVRRTYVRKRDGKSTRPLGLPTWQDKLLQEVIRLLLEAYYEPQFSDLSHGFRPGRGCHTALQEIKHTHRGTKWFIEGDIAKCFERLDHAMLVGILRESIHDERFIRLISNLLRAGYLEDWKWHATLSGSPQGAGVSPLLSNLYLDKLDKFVEQGLIPKYTKGELRRRNPEYRHYESQKGRAKRRNDRTAYQTYDKRLRSVPALDPYDPDFRRLRYVRYADDTLLAFAGPRNEAEEIKRELTDFLGKELKLELSQTKTHITHGRTEPARFLGYEIRVQQCDTWRDVRGYRNANGEIALAVPPDVLQSLCSRYMREGKPTHRGELLLHSDFDIVARYQAEYRGYVQYYALAQNRCRLDKLRWIRQTSLLKTLAAKHKSTVQKMATRYGATLRTDHGPRQGLRVTVEREGKTPLTAEFGGVPLRVQTQVSHLTDRVITLGYNRSGLIQRLLAETCELCGSTDQVEVHHVRKLADLQRKGRRAKPLWVQRMAALRRKTLVVCQACHHAIHRGESRPSGTTPNR